MITLDTMAEEIFGQQKVDVSQIWIFNFPPIFHMGKENI